MFAAILPIAVLLFLAMLITLWADREERRRLEWAARATEERAKNNRKLSLGVPSMPRPHYPSVEDAVSPLLGLHRVSEERSGAEPAVIAGVELSKAEQPEHGLSHHAPVAHAQSLSVRPNI
jgi:hypothetical protein